MQTDRDLFIEQGFLVIPDVVPVDLCEATIDAILRKTGVRRDDESTWHCRDFSGHGIVPLHHDQALWDIRQWPGVHEAFSVLYDDEQLWVSMDRVSCKYSAA